ncbi:hypothetical protein Fsol_00511 [Candidatus Fokinia solitaria]|uniref:Uncharacterized protein n=1 Tax=Candidatus Fokinia solitaria TaxID=1802984 RepID=A0A2U8BSM2_9RICK|nr:hypothetical protein [Candidatus Fokinia solitaria]AWD33305.1 hypothetical protein Fsol_00511 [Candidatus Fokinia solitaria]
MLALIVCGIILFMITSIALSLAIKRKLKEEANVRIEIQKEKMIVRMERRIRGRLWRYHWMFDE